MTTNFKNFYLEARSRETGEWCVVFNADCFEELIDTKAEFIRETDDYDGYRMVVEELESE